MRLGAAAHHLSAGADVVHDGVGDECCASASRVRPILAHFAARMRGGNAGGSCQTHTSHRDEMRLRKVKAGGCRFRRREAEANDGTCARTSTARALQARRGCSRGAGVTEARVAMGRIACGRFIARPRLC